MSKKIAEINSHSKEVQDILGRIPSWLIRNGIVMVLLIVMVLIAGSWYFKYPDVISAPVVVAADASNPAAITGYARLPMKGAGKVKVGQRVNLKFITYPYLEYGTVKGVVSKISSVPSGDYYALELSLPDQLVSTFGKRFEFREELKGTAEIITDEERLLNRIFSPMRKALSK
jgi:HlyD family secretion protein